MAYRVWLSDHHFEDLATKEDALKLCLGAMFKKGEILGWKWTVMAKGPFYPHGKEEHRVQAILFCCARSMGDIEGAQTAAALEQDGVSDITPEDIQEMIGSVDENAAFVEVRVEVVPLGNFGEEPTRH